MVRLFRSHQVSQLRLDVHGPPSPVGFGISRVLGSASSLRHTANRRGGRSACITESRRSKGGLRDHPDMCRQSDQSDAPI